MSQIWQAFLTFIQHFLTSGQGFLVASSVAGLQAIEQGGGALLVTAVDAAVQAAENDGGSGTDKFNSAKAAVEGTLTSQGIPLIEQAIRLALEQGVARLRAGQIAPAAPSADAPSTNAPAA